MRVDQPGWNDIPHRKPDPHGIAHVSRKYLLPASEVKRLRAHFWRDQLHHYIQKRKNQGGQ